MTKRQHHSIEAEQSVLGGVLFKPEVLRRLDVLEAQDFYNPKHQAVWSAILACSSKGRPIDRTTVLDELDRAGKAQLVGGEAAIAALQYHCPSAENVQHYAKILVRHRTTRDLAIRCQEIVTALESPDNADDPEFEGEGAVQWAMREIGRIKTREKGAELTIGDVVKQRMRDLAQIWQDRENGVETLTGLPTGIADLDEKMGGYQRGIVTVIAGRPAMGKSAVLRSGAEACSAKGIGVHVFSLEDTRDAYADRTIAFESKVPAETMRRAQLNRGEFDQLTHAVARLRQRQGWLVDDRSGLTANEIVRSWRRAADTNTPNGTKLVQVDYLQRIRKRDPRLSTHDHIGECMTELADAAKADNVAVVVGCQLNRGVEQREDKRPMLSDLRESGYTEELSKCVIGCYRGAYYGPHPVKGIDYEDIPPRDFESLLLLLVLKNSNGRTGQARGTWHGPTVSAR